MESGLYEKLLDNECKNTIEDKKYKKIRNIDSSEISRVVSTTYQKIIRATLSGMSNDIERIELIKNLNKTIGIEDFKYDDEDVFNLLNKYRPKTSISTSTLFTGYSGPTLESELSREIRTADRIDFLISFIKFSGLRLIYDDLVHFTKTNKLRVITTSYMGASDYKAILELSKLPNTEVKISYDTEIIDFMLKPIISKDIRAFLRPI